MGTNGEHSVPTPSSSSSIDPSSPTTLLYQHDASLTTHDTTILSLTPLTSHQQSTQSLFKLDDPSKYHILITCSTIFAAQGGGQPSDTGNIHSLSSPSASSFKVLSTRYGPNRQILHMGHFVSGLSSGAVDETIDSEAFRPGALVRQEIDSAKRNLHARIHTAGHILGLAVRELRDEIGDVVDGKAMHYPESAFVEFHGIIEGRHKAAIQAKADEIVGRKIPVNVHFWTEEVMRERCVIPPAEAMVEEVGKGELLRAVDVEGLGAYPCGGTPTVDTGSCGLVVRRISRQKGASKISYQVVEQ